MNNDNAKKQEDLLSEYIDALNLEEKPIHNEELDDLFETVKALRRLRYDSSQTTEKTLPVREKKTTSPSFYLKRNFLRATAVAAVFLLMMTGLFQFNRSDSPNNIVYAMIQAYEEIDSLEGVMEFTLRKNKNVLIEETRLITYKKPDMFRIITIMNARTFTKLYDGGDTMVSFHGEGNGDIIIDYMSDELLTFFLEDYHIGTYIYDLEGAIDIEKIGEETINGRTTDLYQYRFTKEDPFHKMWVDNTTNLPLKIESNYNNGDQMIREYVSLTINPILDNDLFSYEVAEGADVHETTQRPDQEIQEAFEQPEDGQVLTVTYEGRIDNHSAEFMRNGQFLVLMLGEDVKDYFDKLSPGTEIRVTTTESAISDNRMIVTIEP